MLVLTSRDQPENWLSTGIPYAIVGRWYEVTPRVLRGVWPKVRRCEAGGARRPAQTRTGTPRAGRDGSLRRERKSLTEQTRVC